MSGPQIPWSLWSVLKQYSIVIPRLQRDYAQGRNTSGVPRIRRRFLEAMAQAFDRSEPLILDFIYGEITAQGRLELLDGQQRLTTLYLLHWYAAVNEGRLSGEVSSRLERFTYETRPGARYFCRSLAHFNPGGPESPDAGDLPEVIRDQPWYVPYWDHDPTIGGMLVMLKDITRVLQRRPMWDRLTDESGSIIRFYFQPLSGFGLTDDLYVQMNSRGKELTEFENGKARLLLGLHDKAPEKMLEHFRKNIDAAWTDVFWAESGQTAEVTDQAMEAYLVFLLKIVRTWNGKTGEDDPAVLLDEAAEIVRLGNPLYDYEFGNLEFIIQAFDCWSGQGGRIGSYFNEDLFPKDQRRLFSSSADLMKICRSEKMTLLPQLFLFAVIVHRISGSPDFPDRLRVLRNLAENSDNEIRASQMPQLLAGVFDWIFNGRLTKDGGFNQQQIEEELSKLDYFQLHPDAANCVQGLENHPLLRGRLAVFQLGEVWPEPRDFKRLAAAFQAFLPENLPPESPYLRTAGQALQAMGDYAQGSGRGRYLFVVNQLASWRDLLTAPKSRIGFDGTREVLRDLLDELAGLAAGPELEAALEGIVADFLRKCEDSKEFCWRYYFVKYPAMRDGKSGYYVWGGDYDLHMLDKFRINSYHRDPYIWAALRLAVGTEEEVWQCEIEGIEFTGEEKKGVKIPRAGRLFCRDGCWELAALPGPPGAALLDVLERHKIDPKERILPIPQSRGEEPVDRKDRIKMAAALIKDLLAL